MYMYISGAELLTMFHSPTVGSHRIQTTLAAKFLSVNSSPTIHRLREKGPHPPYKEVSLKLGQGYCIQSYFCPMHFFFCHSTFPNSFFLSWIRQETVVLKEKKIETFEFAQSLNSTLTLRTKGAKLEQGLIFPYIHEYIRHYFVLKSVSKQFMQMYEKTWLIKTKSYS